MNGYECGSCGVDPCVCDPYPGRIGYIFHQLRQYYTCEYKQELAMKGILMVLDRIEEKGKVEPEQRQKLRELVACIRPAPKKKWWQHLLRR